MRARQNLVDPVATASHIKKRFSSASHIKKRFSSVTRFLLAIPLFSLAFKSGYNYGISKAHNEFGEQYATTKFKESSQVGIKWGARAVGITILASAAIIFAAPILIAKYGLIAAITSGIPATAGLTAMITTKFYIGSSALLGLGFLAFNALAYTFRRKTPASPTSPKLRDPELPSEEGSVILSLKPAPTVSPVYPPSPSPSTRLSRQFRADGTNLQGDRTVVRNLVAHRGSVGSETFESELDPLESDSPFTVEEDDTSARLDLRGGPQHSPESSPKGKR